MAKAPRDERFAAGGPGPATGGLAEVVPFPRRPGHGLAASLRRARRRLGAARPEPRPGAAGHGDRHAHPSCATGVRVRRRPTPPGRPDDAA